MLVPGSNLLSMALGVIRPQAPQLLAFTGRVKGPTGIYVNTYADPVTITGSFQAIDPRAYQQLGLDMAKTYSVLYTSTPIRTVAPDGSGDIVLYGGERHKAESETDWQTQDGWRSYVFIKVTGDD